VRELRALVEAVEARDARGAGAAMVAHVRAAARLGIAAMRASHEVSAPAR
jgi:DNA-binding GntR family transcriptional regulator